MNSFDEIKSKALHNNTKKVIALACADDEHSLEAIRDAELELGVDYLLIGDKESIIKAADAAYFPIERDKIIHAYSSGLAAEIAVEMVRDGSADILMKGKIQTGTLLKAVVDKKNGIRTGGLMSHMAVLECPEYHKLLYITDGGMVASPNFEQKKDILLNCVEFLTKMGYNRPKVAALAAVETINDKMQETVDAALLAKQNREGLIPNCLIEGPLSFDLAISLQAAKIKAATSDVSGDVDILLAPNISCGNITAKSLIYLAKAKMAGCILGAKAPIVLVSRGASSQEKMLSILLTMAV